MSSTKYFQKKGPFASHVADKFCLRKKQLFLNFHETAKIFSNVNAFSRKFQNFRMSTQANFWENENVRFNR
jgi:hypothetical protein